MKVQKVSLTLPNDLVEEARAYSPDGNLSAYVSDGLRGKILSDRLRHYLDALAEECGALTEEQIAAAEDEWMNAR